MLIFTLVEEGNRRSPLVVLQRLLHRLLRRDNFWALSVIIRVFGALITDHINQVLRNVCTSRLVLPRLLLALLLLKAAVALTRRLRRLVHLAEDHDSLRVLLQVRLIVDGALIRHVAVCMLVQPLLVLNIETGLLLRLELILGGLVTTRVVD